MILQVFDRPMCCSSGVCGPEVDPALVAFSADLQWLERQGVNVQRINPAHQSERFSSSQLVRLELKAHGAGCLPVIVVNGEVVSRGVYPSRQQLAAWVGIVPHGLPVLPGGCCGEGSGPTGSAPGCGEFA